MNKIVSALIICLFFSHSLNAQQNNDRAKWFSEARFGMFIHWGLYSELGGSWNGHTLPDTTLKNGNNWYAEWIQPRLEVPKDAYQALVKRFNPINFDADEWVTEARLAGMKYLVITSKHHDGFALWDSEVSDYDMGATPCKRDILAELVTACRKQGLRVGFYYSHWQDWEYDGGALPPWDDVKQPSAKEFTKYWNNKCIPQVKELCENYKPDLLWFDTWNNKPVEYGHIDEKRRDELIKIVRKMAPNCLINGRILASKPGDDVDYLSAGDNQHPEKNLGRPWQTPATMNHTWAWHSSDFNWKSSEKMIKFLVHNVSLGGNYLLNIGPTADGRIPAPSIRRMREIGGWIAANGESIYGAMPLDEIEAPDWGKLTSRTNDKDELIVYAHVFDWQNGTLILPGKLGKAKSAIVLETGQPVEIVNDGTAFIKPSGALQKDITTLKFIMEG